MVYSDLAQAVKEVRRALAADWPGGAVLSLMQASAWTARGAHWALRASKNYEHRMRRVRQVEDIVEQARRTVCARWCRTSPKRGRPAKVRTTEVRHAG